MEIVGKVGDVRALVGGNGQFPFVLREGKRSIIVEDAKTSEPIARYPETPWIQKVRTHRSGGIWASAKSTNHVYIFALEGDRQGIDD